MQFIGRVFDGRSRVVPVYTSKVFPTRAEAAAACFTARRARKFNRCMVSEARYNADLKQVVATHYGVQWVDRPLERPLSFARRIKALIVPGKRLIASNTR